MKVERLQELVLQSLEHEMGGVQIYAMALTCAVRPDLKKEWEKYHAETKVHVTTLQRRLTLWINGQLFAYLPVVASSATTARHWCRR